MYSTSWSRALPHPSWNPISLCFLHASSSPCTTTAVYFLPCSCGSSFMIAVKKKPKSSMTTGPYLYMDAVLVDGANVAQFNK